MKIIVEVHDVDQACFTLEAVENAIAGKPPRPIDLAPLIGLKSLILQIMDRAQPPSKPGKGAGSVSTASKPPNLGKHAGGDRKPPVEPCSGVRCRRGNADPCDGCLE